MAKEYKKLKVGSSDVMLVLSEALYLLLDCVTLTPQQDLQGQLKAVLSVVWKSHLNAGVCYSRFS